LYLVYKIFLFQTAKGMNQSALSSNQGDLLQKYQILRAGGVSDEDLQDLARQIGENRNIPLQESLPRAPSGYRLQLPSEEGEEVPIFTPTSEQVVRKTTVVVIPLSPRFNKEVRGPQGVNGEFSEQGKVNGSIINRGNVTLPQIVELMSKTSPSKGDIFIFDFDNTLATNRQVARTTGLISPALGAGSDRANELISTEAIYLLAQATRVNPIIVLTGRDAQGVAEVERFLARHNVIATVYGTIASNGAEESKGAILKKIWPRLNRTWGGIRTLNFADDDGLHLDSVRDAAVELSVPVINLYQVDLAGEMRDIAQKRLSLGRETR
jgi:hypothetical protein